MAKCAYLNCNERKTPKCPLTFFLTPIDHRRPVWLKHASIDQPDFNTFVFMCQKHFYSIDICHQGEQTVLKKYALPVSCQFICDCTQTTTDPSCANLMDEWRTRKKPWAVTNESVSPDQSETAAYPPEPDPYQCTSKRDVEEASLRLQLNEMPKKDAPPMIAEDILRETLDYHYMEGLDDDLKSFIFMQLFRKKSAFWQQNEKQLFLNFYKKYTNCYRALCKIGFNMPSERTVRGWNIDARLPAGILPEVLNLLREKAKQLTSFNRKCVLMSYDIALKRTLEYNSSNDMINGFVDFGEFGRHNKIASKVIVFTLRGLNRSWKQTICYYFGTPEVDVLANILIKVTTEIIKCGYTIVATTCDATPEHIETYEKLCVPETAYMEIENQKIFLLYDHQFLFKLLRNELLHYDIHIEDEIVQWQIMKRLFQNKWESLELTHEHLYPNNKNSIKLAVEIFADEIGAGIFKEVEIEYMNRSTDENHDAHATALFFLRMNRLLKFLSTGILCSSTNQKEKFVLNTGVIINFMSKARSWIGTWLSSNTTNSVPLCFTALQHTLGAIEQLWEHLKTSNDQKYLYFDHLFLDPFDNMLSTMRWVGYSYEENLSATQIMRNLKKIILSTKSFQSIDSRSEDPLQIAEVQEEINYVDESKDLIIEDGIADKFLRLQLDCPVEPMSDDQKKISRNNVVVEEDANPYKYKKPDQKFAITAVTFFAGFVARKLKSKLRNCTGCMRFIIDEINETNVQKRANLIKRLKTYETRNFTTQFDQLIITSEKFILIVRRVQQIFVAKIVEFQTTENVIETWIPEIIEELDHELIQNFCKSTEHKEIITTIILKGILLYTIKNTAKKLIFDKPKTIAALQVV